MDGLANRLPKSAGKTQLFQHVAQFLPNPNAALKTTHRAVAYLLVNQVMFYKILSAKLSLEPIDSSKIKNPSDLHELYFKRVIDDIDYKSVFGIDVSRLVPKRGLQYIRDLVEVVEGMRPEAFSSDFLGSMFHSIIPLVVRKPLAAYYTNQAAATLLAALTVTNPTDKVADLACGSGTLLMAAYDRKAQCLKRKIVEQDHQHFIREQLTGIDVMAFAGHLAAVRLALKQPTYLSNVVRIGVEDSLPLHPGYTVKSLQTAMPLGQSKISHFSEAVELKQRGSVGQAGAGAPFDLTKVDVILMNPPFTRKQRITPEYRAELRKWLSLYNDWISDSYSLWAYFVLLSDKFIKNGGKIGFVLPVAILRQTTYSILRDFICLNYEIKYVIVGGYKCAFSENTAFRECLLVLKKKTEPEKKTEAHFIFLKEVPTITNTSKLINNMMARSNSEVLDIHCATQEELCNTDDWWDFIPEPKLSSGFEFKEENVSTLLDVLGDKDALKQGLRFHGTSEYMSPTNSIISRPRKNISIEFEIIDETKSFVVFTNRMGMNYRISKNALCPSIRTLSHQKTIRLTSPPDWLVIDRFEEDNAFWETTDITKILFKRQKHMKTRLGNVVWAGKGNYDIAAPGSCTMAIVSDIPIAPTWNCWRLVFENLDDAKIFTLYLNSTFALAIQLDISIEVRGSVRQWRHGELLSMPVINPKKLSEDERKTLLNLYEELSDKELPSLSDQLNNGNDVRDKIDRAIADVAIRSGAGSNKKIRELQNEIAERIILWIKMMEG